MSRHTPRGWSDRQGWSQAKPANLVSHIARPNKTPSTSRSAAPAGCTRQRRWSAKDGRWARWPRWLGLSSRWPSDPDEHDPHRVRLSANEDLVPYRTLSPLGPSFMVELQKAGKDPIVVVPTTHSTERDRILEGLEGTGHHWELRGVLKRPL
jgi:hypothetical protein